MTDPDFPPDASELADEVVRNENTSDMFGGPAAPPAPAAAPPEAYQVLARKYRPRAFEDLIGQEAMVRTLANAFSSGRIAHAFMLTGVRGVGKTTTARLLARALNYETAEVHRPSVDLTQEGRHCRAIIEGRHMDVLELDAASRTKVDEMRELLDGARYAPVEARNKVYIIDEVHMLSNAAFNALLKTLEEPPPHVKFIFATTEIRKVPVTILSRCQRFDLRRVEPEVLVKHLAKVCAAESALVADEGLALIARAAEGSVRDALSLLDQAMVQAERGQIVPAEVVRDMLGLADRALTIALFEAVMRGAAAEALTGFRELYRLGADPVVVMLDLLEHVHGATVAKTLGPEALALPKDQAARLAAVGAEASAGSLARLWQMLLKAHDDTRRAPDPAAAVEMALVRLCYAADLPGPEEALKKLQAGEPIAPGARAPQTPAPSGGPSGGARAAMGGGVSMSSVRPAPQAAARQVLDTFQDVVKLIDDRRDVTLKLDVERFLRLVEFTPSSNDRGGVIAFEPAEGAPSNLAQRLATRLKEWTGDRWLMKIEGGGGAETPYERERREDEAFRRSVEAHPFVRGLLDAFPGAEIIGVRKLAAPAAPEAPDNPDETPDDDDGA